MDWLFLVSNYEKETCRKFTYIHIMNFKTKRATGLGTKWKSLRPVSLHIYLHFGILCSERDDSIKHGFTHNC